MFIKIIYFHYKFITSKLLNRVWIPYCQLKLNQINTDDCNGQENEHSIILGNLTHFNDWNVLNNFLKIPTTTLGIFRMNNYDHVTINNSIHFCNILSCFL